MESAGAGGFSLVHGSVSVRDRIPTIWKQAVSAYFDVVDVSKEDAKLFEAKASEDVVTDALHTDQSPKQSQDLFIYAVKSAGTHAELVQKVKLLGEGDVPTVVSNQIATFLRYATAIDTFLESLGSATLASAFLFGVVRFMLNVAVKNLKLLNEIHEKFVDLDLQLSRLNVYSRLKDPSEAVRLMCIRVLCDTLRFCALATKYFSSNASVVYLFRGSIKLKNQMDAVIHNLEKDITIEIATGISHLVEQMKDDRQPLENG